MPGLAAAIPITDMLDEHGRLANTYPANVVYWDVATIDEIDAMVESRRDAVAEGVGKSC
jgi:hypothetical protein